MSITQQDQYIKNNSQAPTAPTTITSNNNDSFGDMILKYNKIAMEQLQNKNYQQAIDILKNTEKLLINDYQNRPKESTNQLIGITLNNLACYYKRISKPQVALKYLKKALKIENSISNDKHSIAGTYLNICAIYSSLKNHKKALKYVQIALKILESARKGYLNSSEQNLDNIEPSNKHKEYIALLNTLIIAYYNMGIEYEYLAELDNANEAFSKGYELASKELGEDYILTQNIHKSMLNVVEKIKKYQSELDKKNEIISKISEHNKGLRYISEKKTSFEIFEDNDSSFGFLNTSKDDIEYTKSSSPTKRNARFEKSNNKNTTTKRLKLPSIDKKYQAFNTSLNLPKSKNNKASNVISYGQSKFTGFDDSNLLNNDFLSKSNEIDGNKYQSQQKMTNQKNISEYRYAKPDANNSSLNHELGNHKMLIHDDAKFPMILNDDEISHDFNTIKHKKEYNPQIYPQTTKINSKPVNLIFKNLDVKNTKYHRLLSLNDSS